MKSTDKRYVIRLMADVRKVVEDEIRNNRQGGMYARGLSSEGFAGGYLQALDDIDGALCHGQPSDHRGYWKEAKRRRRTVGQSVEGEVK
ncbi:MAG TPA: hypothetical protein VMT72_12255 [Pseudolabrys sp.]|nr:hypothetical protein [Pseudolabrys sp.]